jgi:hypothetical protein
VGTGDVFLGCEDGSVYCFRPLRNQVVRLPASGIAAVTGLATDDEGEVVVALRASAGAPREVTGYVLQPDGTYRVESTMLPEAPEVQLIARLAGGPQFYVAGLLDGERVCLVRGPLLVAWGTLEYPAEQVDLAAGILLPAAPRTLSGLAVVLFGSGQVWYGERPLSARPQETPYSWQGLRLGLAPAVPENSALQQVPIASLPREDRGLELAALGEGGAVLWAQLEVGMARLRTVAENVAVRDGGYRAATLVRPGLVAAAAPMSVHWLGAGGKCFVPRGFTWAPLPRAVACFPSPATGEVLVVCTEGSVVRLSIPA